MVVVVVVVVVVVIAVIVVVVLVIVGVVGVVGVVVVAVVRVVVVAVVVVVVVVALEIFKSERLNSYPGRFTISNRYCINRIFSGEITDLVFNVTAQKRRGGRCCCCCCCYCCVFNADNRTKRKIANASCPAEPSTPECDEGSKPVEYSEVLEPWGFPGTSYARIMRGT